MPRLDKTFSSFDIVRIWKDHLDVKEQSEIICFFSILGERKEEFKKSAVLEILGFLIGQIPDIGGLISFFLSIDKELSATKSKKECTKAFRLLAKQAGITRKDLP